MPTGQQGGAFLPKTAYSSPYVVTTITGDALIPPVSGVYFLTKATAAAITVPLPKAGDVGTELIFVAGTAVAHVVNGSIDDGVTGGAKTKWTSAAFVGSSITLCAMPNLRWSVIAQNLGSVS